MSKNQKLVSLSVFIGIFLFTLIGYWRISISNTYRNGFQDLATVSGDVSVHNSSVFYLFDGNSNTEYNISGGSVLAVFAVYDILGHKEYKPISRSISSGGRVVSINTNKVFHYDTEVGFLNSLLRNSIFDKGAKLAGIIIQFGYIEPKSNIQIKEIIK